MMFVKKLVLLSAVSVLSPCFGADATEIDAGLFSEFQQHIKTVDDAVRAGKAKWVGVEDVKFPEGSGVKGAYFGFNQDHKEEYSNYGLVAPHFYSNPFSFFPLLSFLSTAKPQDFKSLEIEDRRLRVEFNKSVEATYTRGQIFDVLRSTGFWRYAFYFLFSQNSFRTPDYLTLVLEDTPEVKAEQRQLNENMSQRIADMSQNSHWWGFIGG